MLNRVFVLTFVGVCLCGLTLAANSTVSPSSNTTRPLSSTAGSNNTTRPSSSTTRSGNTTRPSSSTTGSNNTTRPSSSTTGSNNTTRPSSSTTRSGNTTRPLSSTTGSGNITRLASNVTYSSPRPTSSWGNSTHFNGSNSFTNQPPHHHSSGEHSDEKLDHNVEKYVIQVLKLFEKILMRHHNKPASSEEESGEHGPHHGQNHEQVLLNNTYCSFGFILYTEFRKALDSQNLSQIAQKLGANVTNSTELQKSGFAGLVELFSRQHPELIPFYEQCPGQVNTILANWAGSRTNSPGLNFTGVAPFPCVAHAGRNVITYNWNNNTRSLKWTLTNPVNGSSNSSNQFNNQTSSNQNSTLPSSGSVSLQFIFDAIDYGYNKIYSEPVITNFAAKYWVSGCPNWYNDLLEIVKFSLVREAPQRSDAHRQKLNSETSEETSSSSEEENQGRRGYGRRGYGRRGYIYGN